MTMSNDEFEDSVVRLYRPVIADQLRRIQALLSALGEEAIEGGADPNQVKAILEQARFNKDGWWD